MSRLDDLRKQSSGSASSGTRLDRLRASLPSKQGYSTADRSSAEPYRPEPEIEEQPSLLNRLKTEFSRIVDDPVGIIKRDLDYVASNPVSEAVSEYTQPDAPMIGKREDGTYGNIEGTNARQDFLQRSGQAPAEGAAKIAGQVIAPFFVPGAQLGTGTALSDTAGGVLNRFAPRLQGAGQVAAREAIAGAAVGAGSEFAQGKAAPTQAVITGALGAAGGAVLGGGAAAAGNAFRNSRLGQLFNDFISGRKAPPVEEQLALPSPTLALPSPRVLEPTTARLSRSVNPYRNKLESLFAEANKLQQEGQIMAGREREYLEDLWGRMADMNDPGLDDLIDLAYPTKPSRLTPNLVQRAKTYQQAREVAGAPLPVRTATDRYPSGVAEPAAAPRQKFVNPQEPETVIPEAQAMKQNWFTNLFGNKGVGISAFGSSKQISKNPLTTAQQIVKNPLKQDIVGVKAQAQAAARSAYQSYVDLLSPLKHISPQAYDKAIDAARANNIANIIVDEKFVSPEGVVIGEGLGNTFRKVGRGQMESFLDYVVLRHAKTRMGRGEEVYAKNLNMTPDKVQARIDDYVKRHPEFEKIAQEWDKFNENMLKVYGVDEGLLSPEMFNTLREQNPHYAPMRRQFSVSEKFASPFTMGAKPAFSGQKSPIKEVSPTGSVRRIVDPRRSAIEATGAWVNAAMRNRVMQTLVDRVKADPGGMKDIIEIVQKPKGQKNLQEILADGGSEEFLESLNNDFNNLFKRSRLDGDNIVRAMIKGQPVYMKVNNPEAVKALIGMGSEQSNVIMDFFGILSNATKYGATGALAPMFAVKSLTSDIATSLIQSKEPLKHMVDLGHAAISSLANTLPKGTPGFNAVRMLAEEYRRAGGEFSAALRGDRPLNRSVRNMERAPLLSAKGLAKGAETVIASPFRALNKVADISENLNRMAAYKGEIRRLGGERTPDNVMKAMNASREITTNYSRKGNQSQTIEKLVPYSNAAVQGMYRFAKQWRQNPFRTAALVGGAVLIPKAYEYLSFADDPDYQKIPARDKYRNIIVSKNEDGTFVKVPMPPEYNALGAFMVDSLEWLREDVPDAFRGFGDAFLNAYTPPQISGLAQPITQGGGAEAALSGGLNSTVLSPAVSVLSNKDFAGRPIESMALSDRSPKYRFDERTSAPAKWLGEKLNMSPMKVDYLIKAYGGDPSRLILPLTSKVGEGAQRNMLLRHFIVDPAFTNTLTNDFYSAKEMLSQAYRDNKEAEIPLPAWYDDDLRKEITSTASGSVSSKLKDLSDEKKAITMDKLLSAEQRTENLRTIQQQMNELYLEINSKVSTKEIPIPKR